MKPFKEADKFTMMHNYLFDVVMPRIKPNAWKVLCCIVRHTVGWLDRYGNRKLNDQLSYSQLRAKTGIASDQTLNVALTQLVKENLILRTSGDQWDATSYGLNWDYEASPTEIVEVESLPTTEIVVGPTTETVAASTTEIVDTKESPKEKGIKKNGGGKALSNGATTETTERPAAVFSDSTEGKTVLDGLEKVNQAIKDRRLGKPLQDLPGLAALIEKRGETFDDVHTNWLAAKKKDNPAGAFLHWVLKGITPKAGKAAIVDANSGRARRRNPKTGEPEVWTGNGWGRDMSAITKAEVDA
jgi:hypothetical protein